MSYAQVISTTLDDTSSNITYAGANWTVHTNVQGIFHLYNNTDTFTDVQGATATLRFYGNYIEYWGNQGPYHGPCSITLDGVYQATVNSHAPADDQPILLWTGNTTTLGTEPKDHELLITVVDPSYPNVCELDKFVVNITSAVGTSGNGTSSGNGGSNPSGSNNGSSNSGSGSGSSGPPVGIIAGVVGGVAGLALLAVAFWLYSKRKSPGKKARRATLAKKDSVTPILDGDLPPVTPNMEKAGYLSNQPRPTSSYAPTSVPPSTFPPSSPPASSVGYTYSHTGYGAGTYSPPPSSVGGSGHSPTPNPPHSPPPPMQRPTSVISATSAAPTASYYSNLPTTTETGGYAAFVPHQQPPQQAPYHPQGFQQTQQIQQIQQIQQPQQTHNITPVWATTGDQPVTQQHQQQYVASTTSASTTSQTQPMDTRPSEKAQYSRSSFPPEKAQYSGNAFSNAGSSSQAGASSSASGSGSGANQAVAAEAAAGTHSQDLMNPPISEAPPPAYQI